MELIFSLNPALGMALFIALMSLLGVGIYVFCRYLFKRSDRLSRQLGVYMFRSSGALLGFLLAVNFSAVSMEFIKLREAVSLEVAQLHDLHEDLRRFNTLKSRMLEDNLLDYSETVVNEEWESLRQGKASNIAWEKFLRLEDGIISLPQESEEKRTLKSRMLTDIDEISDYRQVRVSSYDREIIWLRIIVYVVFVLSIFYLGVFAIRPVRLVFVGLYSAAIGLVLYSIISMGRPFQGVAQVSSEPFQRLNDELHAKTY